MHFFITAVGLNVRFIHKLMSTVHYLFITIRGFNFNKKYTTNNMRMYSHVVLHAYMCSMFTITATVPLYTKGFHTRLYIYSAPIFTVPV